MFDYIKKILALSATLALAIANANTITVDTYEDNESKDGKCSLREAVIAANDNIAVDGCVAGSPSNGDQIVFAQPITQINVSSNTIDIKESINIEGETALGKKVTITSNNNQRVFAISGENTQVLINGLNFADINNKFQQPFNGGVIYSEGTLTLSNCTFKYIDIELNNTSGNADIFGGVLYAKKKLHINHSQFDEIKVKAQSSQTSQIQGGIVYAQDKLTIEKSRFEKSTFLATADGGMGLNAKVRGGIIYAKNDIALSESELYSTTVKAVNALDFSGASISDVRGGFIYSEGDVNVKQSNLLGGQIGSFSDNIAIIKGAVLYADKKLMVKHSNISDNEAVFNGADLSAKGVGIYASGELLISNSSLKSNTVDSEADISNIKEVEGGAVWSNATLAIKNSLLSENASGLGGAIYASKNVENIDISNSTLTKNNAKLDGSVIYGQNPRVFISNSTIVNNKSEKNANATLQLLPTASMRLTSNILVGNTIAGKVQTCSKNFSESTVERSDNNLTDDENDYCKFQKSNSNIIDKQANKGLGKLDNHGCSQKIGFGSELNCVETISISKDSQAIDKGRNPRNLRYDQRGEGHPRTLGENIDIGAFESNHFKTLNVTPSAGGAVNGINDAHKYRISNCTEASANHCSAIYPSGELVTLQAVANKGYRFEKWEGDCMGNSDSITFELKKDTTCLATFSIRNKILHFKDSFE